MYEGASNNEPLIEIWEPKNGQKVVERNRLATRYEMIKVYTGNRVTPGLARSICHAMWSGQPRIETEVLGHSLVHSLIRSFAHTAHSFACSALLALLAHSAALV